MIKQYYKYTAVALATFLWMFFVGPRMLSGPTETFILWWVGTIFVVSPLLLIFIKREISAFLKKEQN